MPISGKLYTSQELQDYLKVSKQRVSNLAKQQDWESPSPGLYFAEQVEPYLLSRNIDPVCLPVVSYEFPQGATLAQQQAVYDEVFENMDLDED